MSSNELVRQERPVLSANRKLTSLDVEEMLLVAEGFHRSQVFKNGREVMSKAEIFVVIMTGQELGIGPAQAVTGIRMISGRPELSANLQAAAIKASGKYDYRVEFSDEQLFEREYPTPTSCTVTVYDTKTGEEVGDTTFTMADADRAGLLEKRGGEPSIWLRYPRNMLFARTISNASAFIAPDAMFMRTYHLGEVDTEASLPIEVIQDGYAEEAPALQDTQMHEAAVEAGAVYEEVDLFDPETEVVPEAVKVPEFARTEEEQAEVDRWSDPDDTPEPTTTQSEHERTISVGQRGLLFVRARAGEVSDERLKEITQEITGQPHVDRIPMRLMDTMLARLQQEKEAKSA